MAPEAEGSAGSGTAGISYRARENGPGRSSRAAALGAIANSTERGARRRARTPSGAPRSLLVLAGLAPERAVRFASGTRARSRNRARRYARERAGPVVSPDRASRFSRPYRFRLTSSWSISSAEVMTRALDWKPRWAVIMLVNSWARSTLLISRAPEVMIDWLPAPANP